MDVEILAGIWIQNRNKKEIFNRANQRERFM